MYLFAIQVEHAEHAEHGPAVDPITGMFQDNLINWVVLLAFLIFLAVKFLPPIFASRKESIEGAINSASQAREEGKVFLEMQKAKVANADQERENILKDARHLAEQMRLQIEEQTGKDVESVLHKIEASIANERQLLITELRTAAVKAAIKVTEEHLRQTISESAKANLVNQFIAQLDTVTRSEQAFSAGTFESAHKSGRN